MIKSNITEIIRERDSLSIKERTAIAVRLSIPSIIAQLSSILMQYIDAAMVGALGANASASVGLVSSTIWFFDAIVMSCIYGFSVQIAHAIGAGRSAVSRSIFYEGIKINLLFSSFMAILGFILSFKLPYLLGGDATIAENAFRYFLVAALFMPILSMDYYAASCLQSAGNMKIVGFIETLKCFLDIIFNFFFIFPSGVKNLGFISFYSPGFGLGVMGAALGTYAAEFIAAVIMMREAVYRTESLKFEKGKKYPIRKNTMLKALKISLPSAVENAALSGAQIFSTRIVAPLGNIAIAAHSFAITAESLCYMPGYGLEAAAATLVGQSLGAGKTKHAKGFANVTVGLGMIIMTAAAVIMYFIAPGVFSFLTPDPYVRELGVRILRIELLAEPFFGASIVAAGALRGAGDTLASSIIHLFSMWVVRISLACILVGKFGLEGVWTAMCIELTFRGIAFLVRLRFAKWNKNKI